jgi:hypothetical protein
MENIFCPDTQLGQKCQGKTPNFVKAVDVRRNTYGSYPVTPVKGNSWELKKITPEGTILGLFCMAKMRYFSEQQERFPKVTFT